MWTLLRDAQDNQICERRAKIHNSLLLRAAQGNQNYANTSYKCVRIFSWELPKTTKIMRILRKSASKSAPENCPRQPRLYKCNVNLHQNLPLRAAKDNHNYANAMQMYVKNLSWEPPKTTQICKSRVNMDQNMFLRAAQDHPNYANATNKYINVCSWELPKTSKIMRMPRKNASTTDPESCPRPPKLCECNIRMHKSLLLGAAQTLPVLTVYAFLCAFLNSTKILYML